MTASLNKLAASVGSLRRQEVWKDKKKKKKATRHREIFPVCSFLSLSIKQGLRQETPGYDNSLKEVHAWPVGEGVCVCV